MLKVIEVVFDGKAFVPTEPVDLPTGCSCIQKTHYPDILRKTFFIHRRDTNKRAPEAIEKIRHLFEEHGVPLTPLA